MMGMEPSVIASWQQKCDEEVKRTAVMASNGAGNPFDRLAFPKDTKQFGVWKDLIIGHLRQKSAALRREAMMKCQDEPALA
ncbi:unnamed protein product [Phytophthora fragariaefolia]|uniref:Unnamed protein product n=1 Tax=Phytophthora fragariaefolia TaxID=1490495 RepID=A0A9W6YLW1_9STRA|nr:unnamed protein product [Phytophthora fragariaefolia]